MRLLVSDFYIADEGCVFILTEAGYKRTPEAVKRERSVGKPVPMFSTKVPASWVKKGYVKEVAFQSSEEVN